MKKKPYIRYLLFIVLCIVFYLFVKDSFSEILKQVIHTSSYVIIIISVASIAYHFMEARITYLLAKRHSKDYTYMKGLKNSFYASFYRVVTLGSAGGISAIYNLHLDHIPVSSGIGLYFVGYVIHKIAILLYGLLIICFRKEWIVSNFGEYKHYFIIGYALGIIIVAILILLCVSPYVYKITCFALKKAILKFPKQSGRINDLMDKLESLQKETRLLLTDKLLCFRLLVDDMIKLTAYYIIPYLILSSTFGLSALDSISIVAITYILAAAIPTPSGMGSIEAVYILLLGKFTPDIQAVSSMLLFRFSTMIVPCLAGGLYIVLRNMRMPSGTSTGNKE